MACSRDFSKQYQIIGNLYTKPLVIISSYHLGDIFQLQQHFLLELLLLSPQQLAMSQLSFPCFEHDYSCKKMHFRD